MSGDRWRWAQKAQEMRFHQLEAARKQAESWRTGLSGLTGLFGAVLIFKGRDNIAGLSTPYKLVAVLLLGTALAALVVATLSALRAASGTPGDQCLLTGEDLHAWTRGEVAAIYQALTRARHLMIGGACAMAAAIGLTWLAPTPPGPNPVVIVDSPGGRLCGDLSHVGDGTVVIRQGSQHRTVPLTPTTRIEPTPRCPP
jgi:hypothetical protein